MNATKTRGRSAGAGTHLGLDDCMRGLCAVNAASYHSLFHLLIVIMADCGGNVASEEEDYRSVFVSGLPPEWMSERIQRVFEKAFGSVESADVLVERNSDESRCFGFVMFKEGDEGLKARMAAVKKSKLRISKRKYKKSLTDEELNAVDHFIRSYIIRIKVIDRDTFNDGRGRDVGVCFQWKKGVCARGDECRFSHDGPGSCAPKAGMGKARKKCFAFRKGKCRKGDSCPFVHSTSTAKPKVTKFQDKSEKPCFTWKKKGKCRKGDACPYLHETKGGDGDDDEGRSAKRRKIVSEASHEIEK